MIPVDLNADGGEGFPDLDLMPHLTSVSIACGGHAGDRESMAVAIAAAVHHGLRLGAHPSYPDRAGFGRRGVEADAGDLRDILTVQLAAIARVAAELGQVLTHVKAHGALYNRAWDDPTTADALTAACIDVAGAPGYALVPVVFCPAVSAQEVSARGAGLPVVREVFLDRAYAGGRLAPRGTPGAVVETPQELPARLAELQSLEFETMCVHGDNPAAARLLEAVEPLLAGIGRHLAPYRLP